MSNFSSSWQRVLVKQHKRTQNSFCISTINHESLLGTISGSLFFSIFSTNTPAFWVLSACDLIISRTCGINCIIFHYHIKYLFFKKRLDDISPFCGATDTPNLDFWWCLIWVSKPKWATLFTFTHLRAVNVFKAWTAKQLGIGIIDFNGN